MENVKFNCLIRVIWRFISEGPNASSAVFAIAIQVVGDFRIDDFDLIAIIRVTRPRGDECPGWQGSSKANKHIHYDYCKGQ